MTTEDFTKRRAWFEAYLEKRPGKPRFVCFCCGYPTLTERAEYDICCLCWWEDVGLDDPSITSPGHSTPLWRARQNFADHLTMYERGKDTRAGGPDSFLIVQAKKALIAAYEALRLSLKKTSLSSLWKLARDAEKRLYKLHTQSVKEYVRAQRKVRTKNSNDHRRT